jgi:hypothetical protein
MLKIGTNGNIEEKESIYRYVFDGVYGYKPGLIEIYKNMDEKTIVYAFAYRCTDCNGGLRIINLTFQDATDIVLIKGNSYAINITGSTVIASINGVPVSSDCMNLEDWNYIVLTYDGTAIYLYHNGGSPAASISYGDQININDDDLIFGQYNCIMDLTTIYSGAKEENWINDRYCQFVPGGCGG